MWEFADDSLPDQNADFHGWDSRNQATAASVLTVRGRGRSFPYLKSVESGKRNKDGKAWWHVRLGDGREKRLQMVINKIAFARHGSLTSLVRSASPNGPWRVLWVQTASCLSSQSSLSAWWVHSFSSHRWESLWSPIQTSAQDMT